MTSLIDCYQSLEQMEKSGERLWNDYTEYLYIYCSMLEKTSLLLYFKMYFEGIFYIFKFQMEKVYLNQISCIGTLLDSLVSADI